MRWPNLLMIIFIQYLIRFSFTMALDLPHALDFWYFSLGTLCSVLLAAGGYIVNDLYDVEADQSNKPERVNIGITISENAAWNVYFATVILAAISCYILAQVVGFDGLWLIAPLASILLYLYAYDLKKRALIGNIVVSLLAAMPVFLVAVFDLLPAATLDNAEIVKNVVDVIFYYAAFAFWLTLIRELIKDAQDIRGDKKAGYKTLAILMAAKWYKLIVGGLILGGMIPILWYGLDLWYNTKTSALYVIIIVFLPLVFLSIKLFLAQKSSDYKWLSMFCKIIMLLGILSMPYFTLSLLNQWP
jgi:4-hydroxybenzoate polyprenyltransferase